jgi:hypothetical protein
MLSCLLDIFWTSEMNFAAWMKSAGLSDKSVASYIGAIKGRLSSWALDHQLTTKQIMEISDLHEFLALAGEIKKTPEYKTWNVTGHGMYGAALNNYQKYLITFGAMYDTTAIEYGPYQKEVALIESQSDEPFDPKGQEDARARVLREVVRRRGQSKFRKSLIGAYGGRCAIRGCPVVALLEAAHITPYLGPDTNSISNGLLLRADLHTLWDLGLIAVDVAAQTIWVSPEVNDPMYQALLGVQLREAAHFSQRPSIAALQQQWDLANSKSADIMLAA